MLTAALVGLLTNFLHIVRTIYNPRSKIKRLRKQGIVRTFYTIVPGETANTPSADAQGIELAAGHLLMLDKYTKKCPANANVALAMGDLLMEYQDTGVFLLDVWPYAV